MDQLGLPAAYFTSRGVWWELNLIYSLYANLLLHFYGKTAASQFFWQLFINADGFLIKNQFSDWIISSFRVGHTIRSKTKSEHHFGFWHSPQRLVVYFLGDYRVQWIRVTIYKFYFPLVMVVVVCVCGGVYLICGALRKQTEAQSDKTVSHICS